MKAGPIVRSILIGLILVLVIGAVLGVITVRRSFPQTAGTLTVPGLEAQFEVYRYPLGMPHINASSPHDLFFAQGYAHAQDHFFRVA